MEGCGGERRGGAEWRGEAWRCERDWMDGEEGLDGEEREVGAEGVEGNALTPKANHIVNSNTWQYSIDLLLVGIGYQSKRYITTMLKLFAVELGFLTCILNLKILNPKPVTCFGIRAGGLKANLPQEGGVAPSPTSRSRDVALLLS